MHFCIKIQNTRNAEDLLILEPQAFLLLTWIALRAQKNESGEYQTEISWMLVPNKKYGGGFTRSKLRTSLKKLSELRYITIEKDGRRTMVKLLQNNIFGIEENNIYRATTDLLPVATELVEHD